MADRFREWTGHVPEGLWQAPGRVNLIGEHTDYNAGLALPFAIDRQITVAVRRRADRHVRCLSTSTPSSAPRRPTWTICPPPGLPSWARYPVGVLWALEQALGLKLPGVDIVIDSTVPAGAGLSSSAALEAAVAVALNELCRTGLDRAPAGRAVPHGRVRTSSAAPVGMLDQLAVLWARRRPRPAD